MPEDRCGLAPLLCNPQVLAKTYTPGGVTGIPALPHPPRVRRGFCGCWAAPRRALWAEQPTAELGRSVPRTEKWSPSRPFQPGNSRTSQGQGRGSSDCVFVAISYAIHYEFTDDSSTSQFKQTIQLKGLSYQPRTRHQRHDDTFLHSDDADLHRKSHTRVSSTYKTHPVTLTA